MSSAIDCQRQRRSYTGDMGKRVLVTGAAGNIGGAVCGELIARGHEVRGIDRKALSNPIDGLAEMRQADLTDFDAMRAAAQGMDALVHLGAFPNDADFLDVLVHSNIVGVYYTLEAARLAGVQRTIVTSTVQVVLGLDWQHRTIRVDEPPAPIGHYAVTKVMAEGWARYYADQHGMSMIVVRPCWVPPDVSALNHQGVAESDRWTYFSRGDAGRMFAQAVEAPDVPFAILFGKSRSSGHEPLDMEPARRLIGFEPRDAWPECS